MAEGAKKWLGYGCLGCAGIMGVLLLIAGGVAGVAMLKLRHETVEDRVLTREVPPPSAARERPDTPDRPTAAAGRVVLDLAQGEFRVEPGPPGQPLRVEANYDTKSYQLEERFEPAERGAWTYRVSFHRTGPALPTLLKELFGGSKPRVRVLLPPDVALDLDAQLRRGAARMELGGLWLNSADFELEQGGFDLRVGEPLRAPMEHLSIHGAMGGCEVSSLGNASPQRLEIDYRMGGLALDLRGHWIRDSEVSIHSKMAGVELKLPRDVVIEGLDTHRVAPPPSTELKAPTLRFDVSTTQGSLDIAD